MPDDEFGGFDNIEHATQEDEKARILKDIKTRETERKKLNASLQTPQPRVVASTYQIPQYINKKFHINDDEIWKKSNNDTFTEHSNRIEITHNDNKFVLHNSVQLMDNNSASITKSIEELLPSSSVGPMTALVPIGLRRPYLGFIPRTWFGPEHQTFLEIHKDAQGNIRATHHDSKGWLSTIMYALGIYSLAPIESAVRDAFSDQDVTFNHRESGNQGTFNSVDCVRFTAAAIEQHKVDNLAHV